MYFTKSASSAVYKVTTLPILLKQSVDLNHSFGLAGRELSVCDTCGFKDVNLDERAASLPVAEVGGLFDGDDALSNLPEFCHPFQAFSTYIVSAAHRHDPFALHVESTELPDAFEGDVLISFHSAQFPGPKVLRVALEHLNAFAFVVRQGHHGRLLVRAGADSARRCGGSIERGNAHVLAAIGGFSRWGNHLGVTTGVRVIVRSTVG